MTLDSSNPLPLYKQLKNVILSNIEQGIYKKGEKIPTEQELSAMYHVSRMTVRTALEELTKENLLVRKQRKGTFVNAEKYQRQISRSTSFTEMCREIGCIPGAKVIKSVLEPANAEDVEELGVEDGERILHIERIRYADAVPISIEDSRFPEKYFGLLEEDLNNTSLYEILKEKYGASLGKSPTIIELIFASYEMARYLGIPDEYPLLCISSVTVNVGGEKICRSRQYIVGDKFKFII
ncbi:MAG: GntR family transcriptional regulator [Oscillospiraceae bacterium]|nr:GntR family transcriptional regulator [Oscillospiraceae bacterium]MDY4191062.1 GntR family transcriptional regulator [Oscillospiraceae bacterium]